MATPFTLPSYPAPGLPGQPPTTSLRPPAIYEGGQTNPHAYAQADAMQALKAAFRPNPTGYMPWFAQQAPAADWSKTYNTGAWMPPWVMNPGNVSTKGTNLGLGGMFGYQGNYGASPGPGVGGAWGGVPPLNPLRPTSAPPATFPGTKPTQPVIQQPNGTYQPGPDPWAGVPATPLKPVITGGVKPQANPMNDPLPTWGGFPSTPQSPINPIAMGGSTMGGDRPTAPVVQGTDGSYSPSAFDPWADIAATALPKLDPFAYKSGGATSPLPASAPLQSSGTSVAPAMPKAAPTNDFMTQFGNLLAEDPRLAYGFTYGSQQQPWFQQNQMQIADRFFGGNQEAMNRFINSAAYANPLTQAERQRLGI